MTAAGELQVVDHGSNNRLIVPAGAKVVSKSSRLEFFGNGATVVLPSFIKLASATIALHGEGGELRFGADVHFTGRIVIKDSGRVSLGNRTTCEGLYILAQEGEGVHVGDDCMISFNVQARTSDAHGIYERSSGARINQPASVHVAHHVWVGSGAMLSKGTRIGQSSIVGANSFLSTQSYPAHSIIAGNPARVLREGIIWDRHLAASLDDRAALHSSFARYAAGELPSAPDEWPDSE